MKTFILLLAMTVSLWAGPYPTGGGGTALVTNVPDPLNVTNLNAQNISGNGAGLTNLNGTFATNVLGYITPQQYGAGGTPDGATDNTAAFQQAIIDSAKTGRTFYIPPPADTNAFYIISGTLYATNTVTPKIDGGSGGQLVNNNGNSSAFIHYTGTGIFLIISNASEQDGFTLKNFQVSCPNRAACGIWQDGVAAANNFALDNTFFYNCRTSYVFRAIGNSSFKNCRWIGSYGWDIGARTTAANFSLSFEQCAGGGLAGTTPLTNCFSIWAGTVTLKDMDINTPDAGQSGLKLLGTANVISENCNYEDSTTNGWPAIQMTNASGGQITFIGGRAATSNGSNPGAFVDVSSGNSVIFQGGSFNSLANLAGANIVSRDPNSSTINLISQLSYDLVVTNIANATAYVVPTFGTTVNDSSYITPGRWRAFWSYIFDAGNNSLNVGFNTNSVATSADLLQYSKDKFAGKVANPLAVNTFTLQQKLNGGAYISTANGYNSCYKMYGGSGRAVKFGTAQSTFPVNEWWIGHASSVGTTVDTFDIFDNVSTGIITVTPNTVFAGTITGNGSGLTNLQHAIIQTNFISGKVYNNSYGSAITVLGSVSLGLAAVSGNGNISLRNDASPLVGGWTNSFAISTAVTTIAMNYTNVISLVVPTNANFTFTNLSSGAGNSGSVIGGQITY